MRTIIYMSMETGECVETQWEACRLFNEGHDIAIMTSTYGAEWVQRCVWEH